MEKTHSDIVIVGGGLTAQLMVQIAAKTGYDVLWIAPPAAPSTPSADRRTTTIHAAGMQMLDALGLWQDIGSAPTPICQIKVADNHDDDSWPLQFGAADQIMAYTVDNATLSAAIDRADHADINRIHTRINTIRFDGTHPCWQAEDGQSGTADLVIACDGARSFIREAAGLSVSMRPAHQTAIIARIESEKPHQHTAFQRFLPDGPLALMPLAAQQSALVWSLTTAKAEQLMAADDDAFTDDLNAAFGSDLGWLSLVQNTEDDKAGTRQSWPLQPRFVPQITAPGLVLAGDAAHALHPLAGMGFNLALADMAVLADCLMEGRRLGLAASHPALLKSYRKGRRTEILALSAVTEALNRMFSHHSMAGEAFSSPLLAIMAGAGMRLFGKSRLTTQIQQLAMGGILAKAQLLQGKLPWESDGLR